MDKIKMDKIVNHLKETGFVFQGSQIYGGLSNTWDYGPLGSLIIKNIKDLWWKEFITKEPNIVGLDSKILLNKKVWEASGHISNFSDLLIENKVNGKRYRADHIVKEFENKENLNVPTDPNLFEEFIKKNIVEYDGSKTDWNNIRRFNLMFETSQGVISNSKSQVFLRPETAQGIFINFANVQRSSRLKVPFGIGQIGKSFRNEVTPGNFIFRTREFEQMELEYFVKPGDDERAYEKYINKVKEFVGIVGIQKENIKIKIHSNEELAHYSKATIDIEYNFPFGWGELLGVTNRTDFDLKAHGKHSGEKLEYRDPITNEIYVPYVIEPSIGVDRLLLAILIDSFKIEKIKNDSRIVLKLDKKIAPYKVAVLPLNKKIHKKEAYKVFNELLDKNIVATYDESGSIGKRYRRQDSIGTPFVITIIDETETENKVTIRHRDSMKQEEINLNDLKNYLY